MERPPALDPELVLEFVGKAHADLQRVQALLAQEPLLIHAAWDWGAGDFETALGAAAHMGNREIATYLLTQGARLDVFAAAMLGQLEIVRAVLKVYPAAIDVKGPHGIPLITHARAGGEPAQAVVEFLETFS